MDNEALNIESALNVQQNIGKINIINDDDLDKKFDNKIWKTTSATTSRTTRHDIKRMDFAEFNDDNVFNIKQNNRQDNIENNIDNDELFNKSSLTKIVPQQRL